MSSPAEHSPTHRPGKEASAIRQDRVVDYRGTAEAMLPVAEASVVQLGPGSGPTDLSIVATKRIAVVSVAFHAPSVGVVIMKPDYFAFMSVDSSEECRINGEPVRRTSIYAQGHQDGFHGTGGARKSIGIALRRNHLIETIAALQGVGPEDVFLNSTALTLSPEESARLRTGVDVLARNAVMLAPEGMSSRRVTDASEAISGSLIDVLLRSQPERQRQDLPHQPEKIVRKAEEHYYASQEMPVSLADLCAATGVSQSTLYRAFHAVCDQPPLAYFHKRRLTTARRSLVKSPRYRGAVKRAALAVGLTEFGRFSVEYRQLFGETPSATLSR